MLLKANDKPDKLINSDAFLLTKRQLKMAAIFIWNEKQTMGPSSVEKYHC